MSRFFNISGYWKEDQTEFEDYIVKEFDDVDEAMDDQIFYYGLSETDIIDAIENGSEDDALEFIITSYSENFNFK
jgi:hypothetical protein